MEILFGAITFLITQIVKKAYGRLGEQMTKNAVLVFAFVLVLIWTILVQANIISLSAVTFIIKCYAIAISTYEVVWKRILLPVFTPPELQNLDQSVKPMVGSDQE